MDGGRIKWLLLIGGIAATLGAGPTFLFTKVEVRDDGFSVRNGIWGMTASADLNYDDITRVTYTREESRGRRGRRNINYYLTFYPKSGDPFKLAMGNDVVKAGVDELIPRLKEKGIEIIDQT